MAIDREIEATLREAVAVTPAASRSASTTGKEGVVPIAVEYPQYLDDNGQGVRCYLRYDQAFSAGEARKRIENMGHEWDFRLSVVSVVNMRQNGQRDSEDWFDEVPDDEPGVRYWKFEW